MRWAYLVLVCLPLAGLTAACGQTARPATLTVSAASDLALALREIGGLFQQETGIKVTFNFGSTGQLARQIERGAPVDLFLSADSVLVEELERRGHVVGETKAIYARGSIVVWTRADSVLPLEDIRDLLRPEVRRIAIANPGHAPYGIAAREALQSAGIWEATRPKLVLGEDVRQALVYAQTGNVDVAIVALALTVQTNGRWVVVPQELHRPIDQALAVVAGSRRQREARQLAAFITSAQGRAILSRYGFTFPGEGISP